MTTDTTGTPEAEALAPCPFCGGVGVIESQPSYDQAAGTYERHRGWCDQCGFGLDWHRHENDAVNAWNTRLTHPQSSDVKAILGEIVAAYEAHAGAELVEPAPWLCDAALRIAALPRPQGGDVEELVARLANHAEDLAGTGVAGLVADLAEAGTRLQALPHPVAFSTREKEWLIATMREHIVCDATGLAPAVASAFVYGFDKAADAILSYRPIDAARPNELEIERRRADMNWEEADRLRAILDQHGISYAD